MTARAADEDKKLPEPVDVDLQSDDGLVMKATFYPGTELKQTVPVILLHQWKGERSDFEELALFLQAQGHAVMVPDLRGHGASTRIVSEVLQSQRTLKAELLRPDDFADMVKYDMEAVKRFLMEKNNAGELNIEKLCLVGSEMGALVATTWAVQDYSWPQLPRLKQGQDVKALVLISPPMVFRRALNINMALDHEPVRSALSYMIIAGKNKKAGTIKSTAARDAEKIYKILSRFHPEPPKKEALEKQSLFYFPLDTSLQGTKLLGEPNLGNAERIAAFIKVRLVDKSFPWTDRTPPFGN